jgi:hypothetical protein
MAMQMGFSRTLGAAATLVASMVLAQVAAAQTATVASDRSAGYVIWPKIVVNTIDAFGEGRTQDTTVQLTNTSGSNRRVQCFIVDATARCSNGLNRFDTSTACREGQVPSDCLPGGACVPTWSETDFSVTLSPLQPFGWTVSESATVPPAGQSPGGIINPVGDTVFMGELKCLQVNGSDLPINANDLKGEATIYEIATGTPGLVDVRSYNAIGIQAVSNDGMAQADQTLCLGSTTGSAECATAEYAQCPAVLILNHFFDRVNVGAAETTDLTLVPCSEDLTQADLGDQVTTTVQFVVYNEFEQRFSASTRFQCFRETQLSRIDSRPGQEASSIWSVSVQGTLTGQTRIRPVVGSETNVGHGVLAVAEHKRRVINAGDEIGSSAYNVNYFSTNPGRGDFVRYTVSTVP